MTTTKTEHGHGSAASAQARQFFWLLLSGGLLFLGCRKSARESPPLVDTSSLTDPLALKIVGQLQGSAMGRAYYQKVCDTYGQAHWDQVLTAQNSSGQLCLVPFSRPGEREVSGMLAIEGGNALRMQVYDTGSYRPVYPLSPTKEQVSRVLHLFDYLLWGRQPLAGQGIFFNAVRRGKQAQAEGDTASRMATVIQITTCYEWMSCMGDGMGNCVSNVTYHSECITEVVWLKPPEPDGGMFGGGGGVFSPGGSGGTGGYGSPSQAPEVMEPPRSPIRDVRAYLSCFDKNMPGKLVLYVDQPLSGSDEPFTMLGKMGHVFLGVEQVVNGVMVRRAVGFHPAARINPFNSTSAPATLGNDESLHYDVRLSCDLNAAQFGQVLAAVIDYRQGYDLENYNCTDFVLDAAAAAGIMLPRTEGWWIFGRGHNPGSFGEDLRKQPGADTQKGISPANSGTCP